MADEPKIGQQGWVPRAEKIARERRKKGGVSGGKNAKRRPGKGK